MWQRKKYRIIACIRYDSETGQHRCVKWGDTFPVTNLKRAWQSLEGAYGRVFWMDVYDYATRAKVANFKTEPEVKTLA